MWGRLEVAREKVACWSTKAAISLKRAKIEEKLLWRAYRKSQTLFRTVPSPTSYGLLFPKIGGLKPHPITAIAIISRTAKAIVYVLQIWLIHSQGPSEHKPMKNFGERGGWAYPRTAQIFWVPLVSQKRVKLRTSNLACSYIQRVHANKKRLKIWEKRERGRIQGRPTFWVPPIISRTGKRVLANKSQLKIWEKGERERIQGLPKYLEYSIIPGSGKATNFKFGRYIHRVHPSKIRLKIFGKGAWAYPGTADFFSVPLLSQEQVKL